MCSLKSSMVIFSILFSITAQANYTATLYEQGSNKQKEIFKFELKSEMKDQQEHINSKFVDLNGNVVVEQNVILMGSKVIRDEINHKQLNQAGIMEVKGEEIHFSKTVDGKTTVKKEKLAKTFVTSSNFQKFVKDNWSDISGGKTVAFRYGVWDRQETVGFEIFKISSETIGAEKATVLKMKPSSFIIAALVNPIIFKFKEDGSRLLEMNGRTAPKKNVDGKFKDLDAEIVYKY